MELLGETDRMLAEVRKLGPCMSLCFLVQEAALELEVRLAAEEEVVCVWWLDSPSDWMGVLPWMDTMPWRIQVRDTK